MIWSTGFFLLLMAVCLCTGACFLTEPDEKEEDPINKNIVSDDSFFLE